MKKYILSLLAVTFLPIIAWAQDEEPEEPVFITVNKTNFPDANFRKIVQTFDNNPQDGKLSVEEIANATYGKVRQTEDGPEVVIPNALNLDGQNIADLKGLEYFTATKVLYLRKNKFTSIDLSTLTELIDLRIAQVNTEAGESDLSENGLDVSNNTKLSVLYCAYLGLTDLNVENNLNLKDLQCNNNSLTSLDVSKNENLQWFICSNNNIGTLNVENNKKLSSLQCNYCGLSELDVSNNTNLTRFYCWGNNISELDVTNNTNVEDFRCAKNPLTELDVTKMTQLTLLECWDCELTKLDLTKNTLLDNLNCSSNHLTTLDLSKNRRLTTLSCDGQEIEVDAFVLDRDKIAVEVTPSHPQHVLSSELFTTLGNGSENTFTFKDGEQEYVFDANYNEHYLVIAQPKTDETGKDIDLRNQVVKYEFDVQNTNRPNETMSVTVTIPYPYIMFVNPLTETEFEEVGDANAGEIATSETFYSGTIYLDYDSWVGNRYLDYDTWLGYEAYLYAAKGIEESNLEDMLHVGENPTPKQIILEKNDWYTEDILPSETPAYVKTPLPGYYAFNRFVEPEQFPQVKQVRKAPRKKYSYYDEYIERAAENFEDNLFLGTLTDLPVDYQSVLTLGREKGIPTGVVGFWRYRGEKVAAHRAYLPADLLTNPNGGDVKGLALKFANDATGIRQIESNEESGAWYNLQGVQMAAPTQKGIYIRNGKKLIVR